MVSRILHLVSVLRLEGDTVKVPIQVQIVSMSVAIHFSPERDTEDDSIALWRRKLRQWWDIYRQEARRRQPHWHAGNLALETIACGI